MYFIFKINQMRFGEIQRKIENAKDLDFGDIISQSIDLFKKVWLQGFLTVLIIAIISFCITFIFGLLGLGADQSTLINNFNLEAFVDYYFSNMLYSIPQTVISSSLSIVLIGAFYRICKQKDLNENVSDDYFYFFKGEYLGKIFLLGLIYSLIAVLAQLLFFIPYIYVFVPLAYFSIIFAHNPDLSVEQIIKLSFSIGNKKWLISFGTLFVLGLLALLGILGCGIGILFTISLIYMPIYIIYKQIIGFDENNDEIQEIGKY